MALSRYRGNAASDAMTRNDGASVASFRANSSMKSSEKHKDASQQTVIALCQNDARLASKSDIASHRRFLLTGSIVNAEILHVACSIIYILGKSRGTDLEGNRAHNRTCLEPDERLQAG